MSVWIRTRVLPWVVWATSAATAAFLWHDIRGAGSALGFAQGVTYAVAPPQVGRVNAVQVAPGQQVRAGQVIATVEAGPLDAERAILAAERGRIEAVLAATRASGAIASGDLTRPFDESIEDAELALRTARSERDVGKAELKALNKQIEELGKLVKERMTDRRELDALAVKRAALKKQVEAADAVIDLLARRVEAARGRRAALPSDAGELELAPLRAELAVLAAREQRLAVEREQTTVLRAPADGQVAAVHVRAGEIADPGAPVVTIVGDAPAPGGEVFVCLQESQAAQVQLGEAVTLRPRGGGGPGVAGHVTRLGPQIAELPIRCRRNPQVPEYGREAIVALDDPAPLLAGQAFTVAFSGRLSPCVTSGELTIPPPEPPDPTSTTAPPAPRSIEVPEQLAQRTRFEPSALTWLPGRKRFVIASDDTGHPKRDEHAPWLFTMDERGRVDPEPLVVAGIDGFSDLESVAPGPGDSLYVLASQSYSRRGRRPAARQVFARVAIGDEARVAASVSLAEQLDRAGARVLKELGIRDTASLDVEGMTRTAAGGLLIGLKAPLDDQGRALIWHLPRPDVLFAGGGVVAAGLSRWGAVPLKVTADGAPRAGGISELLELPDGSLLIAATASGTEPKRQDGGLWHATSRDTLASARQIRSFPGLKPEGLALRADRSQLVIVFDTGSDTPKHMALPWPEINN